MSQPRQIIPGTTYLITRRVTQRRFFLRPSPALNRAIGYCVGHAARLFGIEVHAHVWLSNHCHLVVTDVEGRLPEFAHCLFRHVAMVVKTMHGIAENVWSAGSYSAVRLENEQAILDKIAYVIANPASAGLVRSYREWPGVVSRPNDLRGCELEHRRPDAWFRDTQPESARLAITLPACFQGRDTGEVIAWLEREVADREGQAARELREANQSVLGRKGVMRADIWDAPRMREARASRDPRFAAITRQAIAAAADTLRAWRRAYREAWAIWSRGVRDVVFPTGTWWVVRYAGASAAPL